MQRQREKRRTNDRNPCIFLFESLGNHLIVTRVRRFDNLPSNVLGFGAKLTTVA